MRTAKQIAETVYCKIAAISTELLPHQQRVIDRLRKSTGLVVAHGLGTGKTLTSLGVREKEPGSARALLPASLIDNYAKEIAKHTKRSPKIRLDSLQRSIHHEDLSPTDLLIIDEAHRARESKTQTYKFLREYPALKKLLLTATPVYNRPSDIASLVNIAAGESVLPLGTAFDKHYVKKPSRGLLSLLPWRSKQPQLQNTRALQKTLQKWVDYHPGDDKHFPSRTDETINVAMTPQQTKLHAYAWGQLPLLSRIRLQSGLPPNKKDLPSLNAFQSQARQISGSLKHFGDDTTAPKIERAATDMKDELAKNKRHKAIAYSNYIDTLKDYGHELEKHQIPYGLYTGKTSKKRRAELIREYNKGTLKALLLSSAGGEGLDLKGTRQVQVLEPHWNEEKLDQVIGRAIRYKSHTHLPDDEQQVTVQHYLTHPKQTMLQALLRKQPQGIEQILTRTARSKKQLNQQLLELLTPPK